MQAQETKDVKSDSPWLTYIKLGVFARFKPYGIEEGLYNLKDQSLTTLYMAEVNIYAKPQHKKYSVYGEYINQPMLSVTNGQIGELTSFFGNNSYFYKGFIRSKGHTVGAMFTQTVAPNWDVELKAGAGQTFIEVREYLTPSTTLVTQTYDSRDTMTNMTLGIYTNYTLRNNLGIYAEIALAQKVPVYRVGLTYKIETK